MPRSRRRDARPAALRAAELRVALAGDDAERAALDGELRALRGDALG